MMAKLKIFNACTLLCAVFSLSSCMKEEIFIYDEEWDNLIKRTKFNPDNVSINTSTQSLTNYLDQKHNWGDIDNECVIQWMAYQLYRDFDITERQYNQIVALYLDTTTEDVNGMRTTPSRSNEWNTRYKNKVGKYTPSEIARLQNLVYAQNNKIEHFDCQSTMPNEDFFITNGDVITSGRKKGMVYITNGLVTINTQTRDESGNYIEHAMIPLKYNTETNSIQCLDYDGKKWYPCSEIVTCNCKFK